MWRLTLARGILFLLSAECFAIMCGAWPGTLVTWPRLRLSMIVLWDFGLRYVSRVGVTGSRIRSPCLVVPGQDASGPNYGWIGMRWVRSISPTQIWVWLLQNAGFWGVWFETEPLNVQSLLQPWPKWPDFLLFTSINGCCADRGYSFLFPVYGWFEWASSGVVGFYDHEPLWRMLCVATKWWISEQYLWSGVIL